MIVSIKAQHYQYTCGDGCCDEWGVTTCITDNWGKKFWYSRVSLEEALLEYLESTGVSIEWEEDDLGE